MSHGRLFRNLALSIPLLVLLIGLAEGTPLVGAQSTDGSPNPVSDLRVVAVTGTTIQVSWTDNSRSEVEVRVTATPIDSPLLFPRRVTLGPNSRMATVEGLHPNTDYAVRVEPCNPIGRCSKTVLWPVRTANTLPCTPRNVRAGTVTMTSITVHWDLCPSNNPHTEFRVRTDATPTGNQVTRTVGPGERSATFSGLSAGTRYSFWVRACNADGCSPESALLSVLTPAPPPPGTPSNLHLCGGRVLCQVGHVTLYWTDNANNEDRFMFEWVRAASGEPADSDWTKVRLDPNDTGHSIHNSSFSSGGLYFFRVQACNAGGCSTYSNRVSYTAP